MFKPLSALAVAGIAVAVPVLVASPAAAATLPTGDELYAISCEADSQTESNFAIFYDLDADTAVATEVGGTGIVNDCAGGAAYDPTTGKSYYLSWTSPGALALVDVTTGLATVVTGISGDSTVPDGLAIGMDGKAYATWSGELYSLDLVTGVLSAIGPTSDSCLYAFSVDPSSGLFYAIQCNTGMVYRVDVATGGLTAIGQFVNLDPNDSNEAEDIYALQIDTAGYWWIQSYTDGEGAASMLFSSPIPVAETNPEFEGFIDDVVNEFNPDVESLLLTYPPRLPATGPADVLPLAAGGAALLGVGMLAVLMVRRRRA